MTIDDVVPVAAATAVVEQAALGLGIAAGDARMAAVVQELVLRLVPARRSVARGIRSPGHCQKDRLVLTVQVRDRRMPAVGRVLGLISFRLAQLGFVRDLRFSLGDGNLAECVVGVPSHPSWLDTEQVVASDAAPADEQTVSAITYRRAGVGDAVALTRRRIAATSTPTSLRFYSPRCSPGPRGRRPAFVGGRGSARLWVIRPWPPIRTVWFRSSRS
ncbi:MAG: hypothetical protein U0R27_02225 [Candidatus Nanopelagicales bacterium]